MAAARRGDVTPASGSRGEGDGVGPGPRAAHRGVQAQAQQSWLPKEVALLLGRGPPSGREAGEGKKRVGASAVLVNRGAPRLRRAPARTWRMRVRCRRSLTPCDLVFLEGRRMIRLRCGLVSGSPMTKSSPKALSPAALGTTRESHIFGDEN